MKYSTVMMSAVVTASLLSTPALALDRANTSEKGSLLVFPKVDVTGTRNTIIRLENDYFDAVSLKCYWKNGTKFLTDFQLELKGNQPIWISAKNGNGTYAVPPFPTSTNSAYEDRIDDDEYPSPVELPANATTTEECVVANAGQLDLNGAEYEACPKKLVGHFSPNDTALHAYDENGSPVSGGLHVHQNELTIASCNQDLTQDQQFHFTKLKFNVWNEQETKYTGAYQCMDSWHSVLLDGGIQNNGSHFTHASLQTDVARFKVKGMKSSVCERPDVQRSAHYPYLVESIVTEEAGLLGVMATTYGVMLADSETSIAETGSTLHMLGEMSGFIAYDPAEAIEERPAR